MIAGAGAGLLGEALRQDDVRRSLVLTVVAALITTVIGFVVGVPLAYLLARKDFPGKRAVEGVIDLPIVFPHTAAGIALLTVYGREGVVGRLLEPLGITFTENVAGIVLAMIFVSLPFLVDGARESFALVDERYEHVARTLGLVAVRGVRARDVPAGLARGAGRGAAHVGAGDQRVRGGRDPRLQPQGHLGADLRAVRGVRAPRRAAARGAHRDRRVRGVPAACARSWCRAGAAPRTGARDRAARTRGGGRRLPRGAGRPDGRGRRATPCCSARAAPARASCSRRSPACAPPPPARCVLAGADVTGLAPERRHVGLVFQDGLLFPHLTVAKNIAYGMRSRARGDAARPERRPRRGRTAGGGGRAARRGGRRARAARPPPGDALRRRAPAGGAGAGARRPAPRPAARRAAQRRRPGVAGGAAGGAAAASAASAACRCCTSRTTATRRSRSPTSATCSSAGACTSRAGRWTCCGGRPTRPSHGSSARATCWPRAATRATRTSPCCEAGGGLPSPARCPRVRRAVVVRPEDVRLSPAPSPRERSRPTVTRLTLQGGHVLVGLEAPAPLEALVPAAELEAAGIGVGHGSPSPCGRPTCTCYPAAASRPRRGIACPAAKGFLILAALLRAPDSYGHRLRSRMPAGYSGKPPCLPVWKGERTRLWADSPFPAGCRSAAAPGDVAARPGFLAHSLVRATRSPFAATASTDHGDAAPGGNSS